VSVCFGVFMCPVVLLYYMGLLFVLLFCVFFFFFSFFCGFCLVYLCFVSEKSKGKQIPYLLVEGFLGLFMRTCVCLFCGFVNLRSLRARSYLPSVLVAEWKSLKMVPSKVLMSRLLSLMQLLSQSQVLLYMHTTQLFARCKKIIFLCVLCTSSNINA
jgi:hypothetical protein